MMVVTIKRRLDVILRKPNVSGNPNLSGNFGSVD